MTHKSVLCTSHTIMHARTHTHTDNTHLHSTGSKVHVHQLSVTDDGDAPLVQGVHCELPVQVLVPVSVADCNTKCSGHFADARKEGYGRFLYPFVSHIHTHTHMHNANTHTHTNVSAATAGPLKTALTSDPLGALPLPCHPAWSLDGWWPHLILSLTHHK